MAAGAAGMGAAKSGVVGMGKPRGISRGEKISFSNGIQNGKTGRLDSLADRIGETGRFL